MTRSNFLMKLFTGAAGAVGIKTADREPEKVAPLSSFVNLRARISGNKILLSQNRENRSKNRLT